MDKDIFIIYIKTQDVYEDTADDPSNYEVNRLLSTGKNKNVIGLMQDELEGKNMTELAALRPKTYPDLVDDGKNDKKAKTTKKCVIKKILNA